MPDTRIACRSLSVARFYGLAVEDGINVGLVPGGDLPWTDDELADIDLCNALLDLERYVESKRVDRQWEALEELLPLIPPGGDGERGGPLAACARGAGRTARSPLRLVSLAHGRIPNPRGFLVVPSQRNPAVSPLSSPWAGSFGQMNRALSGIGGLLGFLFVALQVGLFAGGISYRKDCLTNSGGVKSSWSFTWLAPIPYLFRPSEDGCEVHTGTRVALNGLGIAGFEKPTTVSLATKLSAKTDDPNLAYYGQLKAFLIDQQRRSESVQSINQGQASLDKVLAQLKGLSPTAKYADVHAQLIALYTASKRYGRQIQTAAKARDKPAFDAAVKRVQAQDVELQAIVAEINRLHTTD